MKKECIAVPLWMVAAGHMPGAQRECLVHTALSVTSRRGSSLGLSCLFSVVFTCSHVNASCLCGEKSSTFAKTKTYYN